MSASSACPATARPARSAWASAATPTGTSRPRSPATASFSNGWKRTRPSISPARRPRKSAAVRIDLNRPMSEIRATLGQYPVATRLSLSGPIIVARDIAHARLKEKRRRGEDLPAYFKDHIIYYAGPAKTPPGYASGSFGPTTAGRMDDYVPLFQKMGGSLVMLAKGNRSKGVTESCKAIRRVLPGIDRRAGGPAGQGLHHQPGGRGLPRTRHGGHLQDHGQGFPRLYHRRRQGQRFLRKDPRLTAVARHSPVGYNVPRSDQGIFRVLGAAGRGTLSRS